MREILKEGNLTGEFEVESVLAKDRLDLTDADRQIIRRKLEANPRPRIVITHGTDTMIETAVAREEIPGQAMGLTGSNSTSALRNNG